MTIDHLFNQIVDEFGENRIPGWCPLEKAMDLASTVVALRPKISIDIGVFGGKSLLPMALACEAVGNGVVIGIDPWDIAASTEGYTGENANWWGKLDHEGIYQGFMANVDRLGLKNRVAIERAKSDDAAVPKIIDLLHVDGQHTDQAVRDVKRFATKVRIGGVVCLDDLEWQNDGVKSVELAVAALLPLGFVELYRVSQPNGSWGMFQRISLPALTPESLPTRPTTARALVASKRRGRKS